MSWIAAGNQKPAIKRLDSLKKMQVKDHHCLPRLAKAYSKRPNTVLYSSMYCSFQLNATIVSNRKRYTAGFYSRQSCTVSSYLRYRGH